MLKLCGLYIFKIAQALRSIITSEHKQVCTWLAITHTPRCLSLHSDPRTFPLSPLSCHTHLTFKQIKCQAGVACWCVCVCVCKTELSSSPSASSLSQVTNTLRMSWACGCLAINLIHLARTVLQIKIKCLSICVQVKARLRSVNPIEAEKCCLAGYIDGNKRQLRLLLMKAKGRVGCQGTGPESMVCWAASAFHPLYSPFNRWLDHSGPWSDGPNGEQCTEWAAKGQQQKSKWKE